MQNIIQDIQTGTEYNNGSMMLVTFIIKDELFGIDVLKVHEIIGMVNITSIPDSVDYLRGVINLRGKVVPVIDMRTRFRLEHVQYTTNTVILIVDINNRSIGLIVDAVSDVITVSGGATSETSEFDSSIKSSLVKSIVNYKDSLILILDTEHIINDETLDIIQENTDI